ncbi:hypothetical protein F4782DRAFT_528689 [Xylaria castorea]|nr:hypothetical protein F4782DRAFT_528689 [Xylaria castorea]
MPALPDAYWSAVGFVLGGRAAPNAQLCDSIYVWKSLEIYPRGSLAVFANIARADSVSHSRDSRACGPLFHQRKPRVEIGEIYGAVCRRQPMASTNVDASHAMAYARALQTCVAAEMSRQLTSELS